LAYFIVNAAAYSHIKYVENNLMSDFDKSFWPIIPHGKVCREAKIFQYTVYKPLRPILNILYSTLAGIEPMAVAVYTLAVRAANV